jgi:hypothetical protein
VQSEASPEFSLCTVARLDRCAYRLGKAQRLLALRKRVAVAAASTTATELQQPRRGAADAQLLAQIELVAWGGLGLLH